MHGDIAVSTGVLRYKEILWPGADIIWFANFPKRTNTCLDILKYNSLISEIRDWPSVDFRSLKDEKSHLLLTKRNEFPFLEDLDYGYFPDNIFFIP